MFAAASRSTQGNCREMAEGNRIAYRDVCDSKLPPGLRRRSPAPAPHLYLLLFNFHFPIGRPHELHGRFEQSAQKTSGDIAIMDRPCPHHVGERWSDAQIWVRRPWVFREPSLFEP